MTTNWPTTQRAVVNLHLDTKNPRLGRETSNRAPRQIIQYLFDHDKAFEVAQSIVTRGYFPNEPLLAIKEDEHLVVVEGNRRLAALKALREPGLLEGTYQRKVGLLSRQIMDPASIAKIPVTIAPSRRATDLQVAGRHIGTPILAWEGENRASFILDKLTEGYTDDQLRDQLRFSTSDIQTARQTRAIADMVRSLDLEEELKAKLDSPRAKVFSTVKRVFDSSAGRRYLMVEPDKDHGLRGSTTKAEFLRGFTKLVTDIALGKASSRTLNTNENIREYFGAWDAQDRPAKKRGSFLPSDIIKGPTVASPANKHQASATKKAKAASLTVVPKNFNVRFGNDRLIDIRRELGKLKLPTFPNAGAVLLRVFFELAVLDYLERTGDLSALVEKLEKKEQRKLPHGTPTMKQLTPEITRLAKAKLRARDAKLVEKALRYDRAAPFSISELHGFVHQADLPSARDIEQFWKRTEPLFRLMLEQDPDSSK